MKKAYWSYNIGSRDKTKFPSDYHEDPKPFRSGYDSRYLHAKCPAWKKWGDNTWLVTQPFDLGFKVKENAVYTNRKFIESSLSQESYED